MVYTRATKEEISGQNQIIFDGGFAAAAARDIIMFFTVTLSIYEFNFECSFRE